MALAADRYSRDMTLPDLDDDREREIAQGLTEALLLEVRDWVDDLVRTDRLANADRADFTNLASSLSTKYSRRLGQGDPDYVQPTN